MKKSFIFFLMTLAVSLSFQSCKEKGCTDPLSVTYDEDAEKDDGSCEYGGTGGSTIIVAKPQHHGDPIIGLPGYVDSAFVKFNAINSPGTNPASYDLVVAGQEGEDHVRIGGMKPGKYYIFMTGYDSISADRVTGGIPVTITLASGEVEVLVPVSE
jgi:hypothetical protein